MPKTSIHEACQRGDLDAVRSIIAVSPAAVDSDDEHAWRPIFHAVLWRQEAVVHLLLKAGADLSAHNGDVLHYAGELPNNKSIVALLIQYGVLDSHVRPTDDLQRQFLAAVFLADIERVGSLLARNPSLATTCDGRGDFPLHHAARNGDTDVVNLLVQHGADINARNPRGHTVLYCAGGHGHVDTVQLLLKMGADIDARFTQDGRTLEDWLAQYLDDPRYIAITATLRQHRVDTRPK